MTRSILSGPPPTPTALKALRGNPGKRPIPEGEPMPSASTPRPPADLDGEALAEWKRVVPELESLGLVTVLDRAYLVAYCEAWSTFCLARRALRGRASGPWSGWWPSAESRSADHEGRCRHDDQVRFAVRAFAC